MGTRHLIAAVIDGQYKIAQYGQWDGYPDGQGKDILEFLKSADMDKFRQNLRACTWLTTETINKVNGTPNWPTVYPHLSRDTGAGVLGMVAEGPLELKDSHAFAAESLFCEWAYVLDLDANVLEVYKGFNHEPVPADQRFADLPLPDGKEYQHVRLVKKYPLDALPTVEQLCKDCCPPEDEE